jgi:hypothetical protein
MTALDRGMFDFRSNAALLMISIMLFMAFLFSAKNLTFLFLSNGLD